MQNGCRSQDTQNQGRTDTQCAGMLPSRCFMIQRVTEHGISNGNNDHPSVPDAFEYSYIGMEPAGTCRHPIGSSCLVQLWRFRVVTLPSLLHIKHKGPLLLCLLSRLKTVNFSLYDHFDRAQPTNTMAAFFLQVLYQCQGGMRTWQSVARYRLR
jgi:hypothetical protein